MNATQTQVRLAGHIKGEQRQFNCFGMTWADAAVSIYRRANTAQEQATVVITDLDENIERELTVTAQVSYKVEGLRGGE